MVAWVQSLAGELRSYKPYGAAKKEKEKKKKICKNEKQCHSSDFFVLVLENDSYFF